MMMWDSTEPQGCPMTGQPVSIEGAGGRELGDRRASRPRAGPRENVGGVLSLVEAWISQLLCAPHLIWFRVFLLCPHTWWCVFIRVQSFIPPIFIEPYSWLCLVSSEDSGMWQTPTITSYVSIVSFFCVKKKNPDFVQTVVFLLQIVCPSPLCS